MLLKSYTQVDLTAYLRKLYNYSGKSSLIPLEFNSSLALWLYLLDTVEWNRPGKKKNNHRRVWMFKKKKKKKGKNLRPRTNRLQSVNISTSSYQEQYKQLRIVLEY